MWKPTDVALVCAWWGPVTPVGKRVGPAARCHGPGPPDLGRAPRSAPHSEGRNASPSPGTAVGHLPLGAHQGHVTLGCSLQVCAVARAHCGSWPWVSAAPGLLFSTLGPPRQPRECWTPQTPSPPPGLPIQSCRGLPPAHAPPRGTLRSLKGDRTREAAGWGDGCWPGCTGGFAGGGICRGTEQDHSNTFCPACSVFLRVQGLAFG